MAIEENKIVTRGGCNSMTSYVSAGFSGELDKCPTKSDINATKKIITLEDGVLGDGTYTNTYASNQCIRGTDVGHYVQCTYSYPYNGTARLYFHTNGLAQNANGEINQSSISDQFICNFGQTASGNTDLGITPAFLDRYSDNTKFQVSAEFGSSTPDLFTFDVAEKGGTKGSTGNFFYWNNTDSIKILNAIKNRALKLALSLNQYTYSLTVTPETLTLNTGDTYTLSATFNTYTNGECTKSESVIPTWVSSNTSVAKVNANGVINAIASGTAIITGSYIHSGTTYTDTAEVNVNEVTNELVLSETEIQIYTTKTKQLTATWYTYTNGISDGGVDVTTAVTWSASSNSYVSVNSTGLVTGVKNTYGTQFTVTAKYGGKSATCKVSVTDYMIVKDTSNNPITSYTFPASGGNLTVVVDCNQLAAFTVSGYQSWLSYEIMDTNKVFITASANTTSSSRSGTYNFVCGSAKVTLTLGQQMPSVSLSSITINNGATTISGTVGTKSDVTITAKYTDGSSKTITALSTVSFNIANTSIATYSDGKITHGTTTGSTTMTASYTEGGVTKTDTITIQTTAVVPIAITAPTTSVSVKVGETVDVTDAFATLSDGSTVPAAGLSYTSNKTSIATATKISGGVRIKGIASGTTTVAVSYTLNGVTKSSNITVTVANATTYGLEVSPTSLTVGSNIEKTGSITATYYKYVNGVKSGSGTGVTSSATWKSSNTNIATVSGGTVTGVATGTTTVTATYSGLAASCTVNVVKIEYDFNIYYMDSSGGTYNSSTDTLTIPTNSVATVGAKLQKKHNGSVVNTQTVTTDAKTSWSSSNTNIATVTSGGGIYSSGSTGSSIISASYSGVSPTVSDTMNLSVSAGTPSTSYVLMPSPTMPITVGISGTSTVQAYCVPITNGQMGAGTNVSSATTWTIADTSVATVTKNSGTNDVTVKGKKAGTTTLSAAYSNTTGFTLSVTVTAATSTDYTLTVVIDNFANIGNAVGGYDDPWTVKKGNVNAFDGYDIECNLYHFDGDTDNTITGKCSEWKRWCNSNSGGDDIYIVKPDGTIVSDFLTETIFDAIYNAANSATGNTSITIVWPAIVTSEPYLEVTPATASISLSGVTQLKATYYDASGFPTNVTNYSTCSWTSGNQNVATVNKGYVTGTGLGLALITASYSGKSDTCNVRVISSAETTKSITIPIVWTESNSSVGTEIDTNVVVTINSLGVAVPSQSYQIAGGYANSGSVGFNTEIARLSVIVPTNELEFIRSVSFSVSFNDISTADSTQVFVEEYINGSWSSLSRRYTWGDDVFGSDSDALVNQQFYLSSTALTNSTYKIRLNFIND